MSLLTPTASGLAAVPVAPLLYNNNLAAYAAYAGSGSAPILAANGGPAVTTLNLRPAAALATDMNSVFAVGPTSVPTALAQNQLTYNALQRGIREQLAVNAATNSGPYVNNVARYQVLGDAATLAPISPLETYGPTIAGTGLAMMSNSSLLDMATAPGLRYSNYSTFPNYPDYAYYPPYPNVRDRPYGCGCRRY